MPILLLFNIQVKKGEVIKEIVPLPIYLTNRNTTDQDLINYVASIIPQAKDISIIYGKLCINQLVKVNGFYYYLGGKTNSKFCIDNAIQVMFQMNGFHTSKCLRSLII